MKADVINTSGETVKQVALPDLVFDVALNADLLHQVVRIMRMRTRKPIAHAKSRGDVSGGGRKPWKQKGTGHARHGSIRSPLWKGGGVTHGPTNERSFERSLNKKMKQKALRMALSMRAKEGKILVLEQEPSFSGKTKQAAAFFAPIKKKMGVKKVFFLHTFSKQDEQRALRNLASVLWNPVSNLALLDVLAYPGMLFTEQSLKQLVGALKTESK